MGFAREGLVCNIYDSPKRRKLSVLKTSPLPTFLFFACFFGLNDFFHNNNNNKKQNQHIHSRCSSTANPLNAPPPSTHTPSPPMSSTYSHNYRGGGEDEGIITRRKIRGGGVGSVVNAKVGEFEEDYKGGKEQESNEEKEISSSSLVF